MQIDFEYKPLTVHEPFHRSTATEAALIGAVGSGKTYGLMAEAIAFGLEQPGSRILITRRTIPELRDTTETVFFDILPDALFKASVTTRAGGHYESVVFPNGSKFLFRSIDDWQKHKSLNLAAIFYDEADEFDLDTFLGMKTRIRQRDPTREGRAVGAPKITRRYIRMATNPAGHNWIYRRYVDPTDDDYAKGSEWFKSTSFDNPYLPPDYIEGLLQLPVPYIKRYVLCQFDDFAGQVYENWSWDQHVVEPMKEYPNGSVFWMGMDPGTRSPTAGLWVYVNRAERLLLGVAEYMENNLAASKHAEAWRAIERKLTPGRVTTRRADPTIKTRDRGTNMELADQYARLGFSFELGPKQPKVRVPALGQLIETYQFKVTKACPRTYEQIKNYQWEDLTPAQRTKGVDAPERPLKKDEHLVDCAQYVATRYVAPVLKKPPPTNETPMEQLSREVNTVIKKQLRSKRKPRPRVRTVGSV